MKVVLEELIERFSIDEDTAESVQEDIEAFADWIKRLNRYMTTKSKLIHCTGLLN